MHQLSVDIETYSSEDIAKSGLYRYAQSPDFELLLLGYSLDWAPVQVVDLTQTRYLPNEFLRHVFDRGTVKHAYNAAFEWYCLSRYFGLLGSAASQAESWLSQWQCTMLHGLYCGYTAGLDATGKALGLPADRQKMAAGKALIRYFCTPCKPTKTNGGRTRNLPHHDPQKWDLFKAYNRQDVVTEMEIERRLSNFPVPEAVQRQWVTDQIINARGVAVDQDMVRGARELGQTVRMQMTEEAVRLSGLDNPNSVAQLTKWLEEETGEDLPDLRKGTVSRLLADGVPSESATRMLEIRQELGKTSTKKYDAIDRAVCGDGRVRGLLQYYGANRTGRWAGRIVQVQNLPRTYIPMLPFARDLVKRQQLDALRLVYGSVPDTLSQLIRTALVAAPGHRFVDADFSAIEARVIAWLAGEQWVLDVFKTHGKIYEACASQMFGVPIDRISKGSPEYALRQKGKVATLALGYQGGSGALIAMGALEMGLSEEELPDIVQRWRRANKRIVDLWYAMDNAAVSVVQTGRPAVVRGLHLAREMDVDHGLDYLTIQLPSGRKLYYAHPYLTKNQWGNDSIGYWGTNQVSRKWEQTETYGGKLVENCVQAIARDCLAEAIEHLEAAGYPVVFHVHDEVVLEVPEDRASLEAVTAIMSRPPAWAPDLPLDADGWVDTYYKKE